MKFINDAITYARCWASVKLADAAIRVSNANIKYDKVKNNKGDNPEYAKQRKEFEAWNKQQISFAAKLNKWAKELIK